MIKTFILFIAVGQLVLGQEPQKMSFSTPEMTDEEQHSSHLPKNMECDACTAITYQMSNILHKEEKKVNGRKLKESGYLDAFEKACAGETYENYGLKSVNGVNRISGKGTEADEVPGMMQGGGKWPGRLSSKCFNFIEEIGEDELYEQFRTSNNLKQFVCQQTFNHCAVKQEL